MKSSAFAPPRLTVPMRFAVPRTGKQSRSWRRRARTPKAYGRKPKQRTAWRRRGVVANAAETAAKIERLQARVADRMPHYVDKVVAVAREWLDQPSQQPEMVTDE